MDHQGTYIKDPRTEAKGIKSRVGGRGGWGGGRMETTVLEQ